MTTISALSATSPAAPRPAATSLGQADFIRLMTTQMKLQDPTDPVDNKEMIAQMAQFSQLSGIDKINSTLEVIAYQLDQVMSAQAAASPTPETPAA
ncbi:MAG: flagellar hook assembly protein FlgD [Novosphingobium sp.]